MNETQSKMVWRNKFSILSLSSLLIYLFFSALVSLMCFVIQLLFCIETIKEGITYASLFLDFFKS